MFYREKSTSVTSGFTLLELLVVIAMVGIISAISAPSWQGFLTRQRMNKVRGEITNVLRDAQNEARSRQKERQIVFSIDASPVSATVRDGDATSGGITTTFGADDNVSQNLSLTASSTTIVFDHDGRVDVNTPFIMKLVNDFDSYENCVVVTTILGGLETANGDDCAASSWPDENYSTP